MTPNSLSKPVLIVSWACQLTAAAILLMTVPFKLSGAPETVKLFEILGAEPVGRIGSGVMELVSGVLLLIPRTAWLGAILAAGTLFGAIMSHLFVLGIVVTDPATGQPVPGLEGLFPLACVAFTASVVVLILRRKDIPVIGKKF